MYTYKLGGLFITDELYHDDLDVMTFGRKDQNELRHSGIKGQKWGKRRFQNEDGSLTAAGRNRYDVGDPRNGVSAYSDTGGSGGSGVSYFKSPSTSQNSGSSGGSSRITGSTGGSASLQPYARQVSKPSTSTGGTQSVNRSVVNRANAGRKAADNLFSRVGNWATNAANDVGRTATNVYNDASKAVGNAANAAGNWVGNAVKDVGNLLSNEDEKKAAENAQLRAERTLNSAIKNSGEYVPDGKGGEDLYIRDANDAKLVDITEQQAAKAKEKYDNHLATKAQNAVNDAGNFVRDNYNRAREAVNGVASDVGDFASNAYNDASKAVGNAAKDVGNFATNAYNDVSKAVSGAANDVGNWVGNAASDVSKWGAGALDKGRQALEGLFGGAKSAANAAGDWVGNAAKDVGNFANNAYNDASKAVSGAAKDTGNWFGNAFNNTKNWVGNAANDVGNWAGNAYNDVSNTVGNAAKDVGNWVGNAANDVGRTATNVYNDASKAVSGAAKDTGNWFGNAFNNAKNWVGNAANDVSNWAGNAYNDASKAVGNAANAAGNWVGNAAKDVGNWAGNAANDVGRTATNVYNDASQAVGNAARDVGNFAKNAWESPWVNPVEAGKVAGNWIGNAANDVGNWAGNAFNNAKNLVGNAANDVGNFAKNAPQNISDWYTGDKAAREANRYGNVAQNFKLTGDSNLDKAHDKLLNYDKWPETAYDLETGQRMRDKVFNEGLDQRRMAWNQQDIARDYNQKANDAWKRYDTAPRQMLNAAGNWIGNAAKDAANWVGDRANDVGNAVGNAYDSVRDTVNDAATGVRDWYTGEGDKRSADWYRDLSTRDTNWLGTGTNLIENHQAVANESRAMADALRKSGDYEGAKKYEQNAEAYQRAVDQMTSDRNRNLSNADMYDERYNNAPRQVLSNLPSNISNAANAAGNWVGNAAKDVGNTLGNAANNVGNAVGNAARDVGDWASNAASDVRDWGAGALDAGREAFENVFGRSEPPKAEKLDPTPRTFTENVITEQRIPEQRITEQRIPEQRIEEQRTPEQRTYEFGDPDMADIARQYMNQQNSSSSDNAQREQWRKEALSDKPNDVSNEYWEAYKSNGGTRESYDREMNARKNSQNNQNGSASRQDVVGTVDTSRPYHFTYDPVSGQTIVVYDDEKGR